MKAAIYARKSNDDNDKSDDNKSVTRQIKHAKAYAKSKGWTVDEEHIYVDDGISGAEYQNRPGLINLLAHVKEFDFLVMSESARFGRDMLRNATYLSNVLDSDVRVFYYLTNDEELAGTPEQKMMMLFKGYASDVERQKASHRSRDKAKQQFDNGKVTGGRVYGYDNCWVFKDGHKEIAPVGAEKPSDVSHAIYAINEEHANIICSIYKMYCDGFGITRIAKTLNGDPKYQDLSLKYFNGQSPNAPAHGTKKGVSSWPPSSIRKILNNERYIGQIPWGLHRKEYKHGTKVRTKQENPQQKFDENLVIIKPALWDKTQKRLKAVRGTYVRDNNGNLWGRPDTGRESRYLLTGFARCGCCKSSMTASYFKSGNKKVYHYICGHYKKRGSTVCSNNVKPKMGELDDIVLSNIEQTILTPDNVMYVVKQAAHKIKEQQQANPNKPKQLQKEITKLKLEVERFMAVIATGNAPDSILQQITERESRISLLEAELVKYSAPTDFSELDNKRLEKELSGRLSRFRELIYSDVPKARQAFRKLLNGSIVITPEPDGYSVSGETRLGALLHPATSACMASPRGFEPLLPP